MKCHDTVSDGKHLTGTVGQSLKAWVYSEHIINPLFHIVESNTAKESLTEVIPIAKM